MSNKHPAMREIWLINAIQNALHEPNCLMEQQLKDCKAFCELLSKEKFGAEEFEFIQMELKTALDRIKVSGDLISKTESSLSDMLKILAEKK